MAKNETLHIRVNDMVKSRAEKTIDILGLSISDAVNMLLHQVNLVGALPFDVRVPTAPESVMIRSKEELYKKLDIGTEQIKEGKVIDADVAMARLGDKYGFQGLNILSKPSMTLTRLSDISAMNYSVHMRLKIFTRR